MCQELPNFKGFFYMSSFNLQTEVDPIIVISIFQTRKLRAEGLSNGAGIHTWASGSGPILKHSTIPPSPRVAEMRRHQIAKSQNHGLLESEIQASKV